MVAQSRLILMEIHPLHHGLYFQPLVLRFLLNSENSHYELLINGENSHYELLIVRTCIHVTSHSQKVKTSHSQKVKTRITQKLLSTLLQHSCVNTDRSMLIGENSEIIRHGQITMLTTSCVLAIKPHPSD